MLSRYRHLMKRALLWIGPVAIVIAAISCGGSSPSASPTQASVPTATPTSSSASAKPGPTVTTSAATPATAATATAVPTATSAAAPQKYVGTLRAIGYGGPQYTSSQFMNPEVTGHEVRFGLQFEYPVIAIYNLESGKLIPWAGTSWKANSDFTVWTVGLRHGIKWSDGQPLTANDVAFTFNMLRDNPDLTGSDAGVNSVQKWLKQATVVDNYTVQFTTTQPDPRFPIQFLWQNQGFGVSILPEHIWKGQDPHTFSNYDPSKGWPVVAGPFSLVSANPQQVIWKRRDNWWAAKTGFQQNVAMSRLVYMPNPSESVMETMLITDQVDTADDMSVNILAQAIKKTNGAISSYTGDKPPYGFIDWWTNALWLNVNDAPFDNPNVRWAISYYLNRDTMGNALVGGLQKSMLPMPAFPGLDRYVNSLSDLKSTYNTEAYDPQKADSLMQQSGFHKDSSGFWVGTDGNRIKLPIITLKSVFDDIGPLVAQQLRQAGFDASISYPTQFSAISTGKAVAWLWGNAGATIGPVSFFDQFEKKAGQTFCDWCDHPQFDQVVAKMNSLASDDYADLVPLFHQAAEIWLKALPEVPVRQRFVHTPYNTRHWTGWPTAANPLMGNLVPRRGLLVLLRLKPVQ